MFAVTAGELVGVVCVCVCVCEVSCREGVCVKGGSKVSGGTENVLKDIGSGEWRGKV